MVALGLRRAGKSMDECWSMRLKLRLGYVTKIVLGFDEHQRLQARMFVLTFLAYTCFHMTRKPQSIVKSVMHPVSATGRSKYDPVLNPGWAPFNQDVVPEVVSSVGLQISNARDASGRYKCPEAPVRMCSQYEKEGDERYTMRRVPPSMPPYAQGEEPDGCNWTIFEADVPRYVQRYCGLFPAHASEEVADGIFW